MKQDEYLAHCTEDGRIQTVKAHLEGTARYAADALTCVGLSQSARMAGLLHDCGKFTQAYQTYLTRAVRGEPVHRGSVNHTFAGVRLLLERYHRDGRTLSDVACEVLALAVGGHHGWFDCVDEHGKSGFRHRWIRCIRWAVSGTMSFAMTETAFMVRAYMTARAASRWRFW